MANLEKQLKSLPDTPGVYLFYNSQRELIYAGKATSLRSRVRSYFTGPRTSRPIERMIHEVADIRHKSTDSVLEAVLLEGAYIKKYRPRYNIDWRDDKSWNYICITRDRYPQVATVREHELRLMGDDVRKKYARMFGPYPGLNAKAVMKILGRMFYFSNCSPLAKRACFYRELGQCLGVCTGEIGAVDYRRRVMRPLILFLSGKKQSVVCGLAAAMKSASKAQNFEEAARLRNQIKSLQRIQDIALINKNFVSEPVVDATHKRREKLRVEGYDISNLGAAGKVGSMVVFDESGPIKSEYKKFNIKTVAGQSDVDCLREVLERRLKHAEWPAPDAILVDGGAPQVNAAVRVVRAYNMRVPVVGIAKGPDRKKNEIVFGDKTRAFKNWVWEHVGLLVRARDEAHRFAIAFQRSKRKII